MALVCAAVTWGKVIVGKTSPDCDRCMIVGGTTDS